MNTNHKTFLGQLAAHVKAIFFSGLFAILPITATIFIVHFTYNLIARWLEPLNRLQPEFLQKIPGTEFVLVMLVIFLFGVLLKFFIVDPIIHHFERIIQRIPFISSVYSSAKQLVNFFNIPQPTDVKRQVVLVEFPLPQYYNIAFLLGPTEDHLQKLIPDSIKASGSEDYVRVFMPNSPMPHTGFFFLIPRSKIIHTNISFEDAIKAIVSCGLIMPGQLSQHDSGTLPR